MRNSSKYSGCSDNDSGLSMGKEYSSSFSSGHSAAKYPPRPAQIVNLNILISDLYKEVKYEFSTMNSVFDVKRVIVKKYGSRLVDPTNYGLFIPHSINKAGKFLQEERLLIEYLSARTTMNLEFLYKHRILWPDKSDGDLHKKINSKVNHNRFIDYIIRNDPSKVKKLLEKGIDPNFHCSSGETPLTLTAKLSKPIEVITALVSGGAHLDYRATDSLTPLHKAAISGNYDSVATLLNFGSSANYLDANGMTPLYYNLLYDNSTKCLEKLLHEHAKLGVADTRGLKEIHQACRAGKTDHLDILLAYGADINSRTESHKSTPLHVAAYCGQEDCVRLLLVRGADRTLVNSSARTACEEARVTSNKSMSALIKDFNDAEIHKNSGFKTTLNLHRRKSEFDITSAYLNIRSPISEGSIASSNGDRSRKKISHKKQMGMSFPRERCSSQSALAGCHIFSDNEDTSGSSDLQSQTHSNKEKRSNYRHDNSWYPASMLSLDNDSLSDNDLILVVVLRKSLCHNYGIDLDDKIAIHSTPSNHAIKNVEIGSPAFLAGIRSEDYLLEINGVDIRRANLHTVSKLFTENPDTVVLKIVRSNKYSDSSTDPSLHYEQFIYHRSKPLRSFASAGFRAMGTLSQYNLNCLAAKPNCESSTTLNSITTVVASGSEKEHRQHRPRHSSRDKAVGNEMSTNFKMSSLKGDSSMTLDRKRSQSTDKKYQRPPPYSKDTILKYRSPLTPGYGSNNEVLKPILKNTSASCGVRENVAIMKCRQHSPDSNQDDLSVPPPQPLITRQILLQNAPPASKRSNFYNKSLPQSNSFDMSHLSRGRSLKQPSLRPTLGEKEPSIREVRVKDTNVNKTSTSEEDFCLPPPISFQ